ncbi:MAG: hypothetical protein LBP98_09365, partial [Tannerella sp.]|nr:hypothetical protein [Tannerella sp.]
MNGRKAQPDNEIFLPTEAHHLCRRRHTISASGDTPSLPAETHRTCREVCSCPEMTPPPAPSLVGRGLRAGVFILFALLTLSGRGQTPAFQWGAVLRSDNLMSANPVNAATSIQTNAAGDIFISGAFPSNATESKNFTRVTLN